MRPRLSRAEAVNFALSLRAEMRRDGSAEVKLGNGNKILATRVRLRGRCLQVFFVRCWFTIAGVGR